MAHARSKAKGSDLIAAMDGFADAVLEQAKASGSLVDKLAAFGMLIKWVAVRHGRLGDDEEREGAGLAALKARVRSSPVHLNTAHQRAAALARWGKKSDPSLTSGNGGPELEALRAKIPRRRDGTPRADGEDITH
jgi:hypothetical protein